MGGGAWRGIDPLWWIRPRADPDDTRPAGGHHPYARPLHGGWSKDAQGNWESSTEDAHRWEVYCEECGDTDGPVDIQSATVRALRGPYPSRRKAEHAARSHARQRTSA